MRGSRVLGAPALTLALAVAAAVGGCGGGGGATGGSAETPARHGGALRIAPYAESSTLLPVKITNVPEAQVLAQITQGLYFSNAEEKVEPLLAEKVEKSSDLREWTFHLRHGVKFSNGQPMTAADVVFSLEKAEESVSFGNLYSGIESLQAPNAMTVVLKTDAPAPALPSILALVAAGIVPDNYGGESPQQFGNAPIGTGPFEVASWKRGQALTLKRNPHYWQRGLPLLDEVVYVNASSDVNRVQQLKAGEVDLINEPPFSQLQGLESTPGIRAIKAEDTQIGIFLLNTRKPLFADPRAREAVNLALNRDDITEAAWKGYGQPAGPYFPLSMLYADKSIRPPAQDVAKAKKLLAEAVKATGEQPEFTQFVETGSESGSATAQVIQQNLEAIGMKTTIQQLDSSSWIEQVSTGHYDLGYTTSFSLLHDPVEQVSYYPQTGGFWTGAEDVPQIEKLEAEALTEIDSGKREALYHQIQQQIYDENALLMLNDSPTVWLAQDNVSGFKINSTGIYDLREVGFGE